MVSEAKLLICSPARTLAGTFARACPAQTHRSLCRVEEKYLARRALLRLRALMFRNGPPDCVERLHECAFVLGRAAVGSSVLWDYL